MERAPGRHNRRRVLQPLRNADRPSRNRAIEHERQREVPAIKTGAEACPFVKRLGGGILGMQKQRGNRDTGGERRRRRAQRLTAEL